MIYLTCLLAMSTIYLAIIAGMWQRNARKWEANSNGWRDLYYKVCYGDAQPPRSPLYHASSNFVN